MQVTPDPCSATFLWTSKSTLQHDALNTQSSTLSTVDRAAVRVKHRPRTRPKDPHASCAASLKAWLRSLVGITPLSLAMRIPICAMSKKGLDKVWRQHHWMEHALCGWSMYWMEHVLDGACSSWAYNHSTAIQYGLDEIRGLKWSAEPPLPQHHQPWRPTIDTGIYSKRSHTYVKFECMKHENTKITQFEGGARHQGNR